jgi:glycosyltransferase involved in cell wall biosynthesis
MNTKIHDFLPFRQILIPVIDDTPSENILRFVESFNASIDLIGLVKIPENVSLSAGTAQARQIRQHMKAINGKDNQVIVSHQPWVELQTYLKNKSPELMVLEFPGHLTTFGVDLEEILSHNNCNVCMLKGGRAIPANPRVLVPLRGGPYAELALRVALALPYSELQTLHLVKPNTPNVSDTAFKGLEKILSNLPEVYSVTKEATDLEKEIIGQSANFDLLILGASARSQNTPRGIGPVAEKILHNALCNVLIVKTHRSIPEVLTGVEGERAGYQAISVLVDKWFAENTYHAEEFDDLNKLVELKNDQKLTISLALPALNEEKTVGDVIWTVKKNLMLDVPLLDEIVLIDSNSKDKTRQIAEELEIPVYIHQQTLTQYGARSGKGEALWKSLYVTQGDIVIWIDTDIVNIHPRFVYGVIGPLLINPHLKFCKGFYQRPLREGEKIQASGGGRVTELTARPLINLFYPELSGVIQPLAGEYGGRRKALERMPFFSGYGVEIGLLIDIFDAFGISSIAQVDLKERIHHNQDLEALSKMSFTIIQAVIRKLERRFNASVLEEVNKTMKLIHYDKGNYFLDVEDVAESERPPIISLPEYQQLFNRKV